MSENFSNFSDDFFINLDLMTALQLPQSRETILQFFEATQKQFPDMADFYQRESGEYIIEGDRGAGSYRWVELETRRLSAGSFNPADTETACRQHSWVLDRSRYYLGISHLDVESQDLIYGFNLDFTGNRDAIVWEALLSGSLLASLVGQDMPIVNCEPSLIIGLEPTLGMQARLAIETHNSSYQIRTGNYEEEPISVYFTVRSHPRPGEQFDLVTSLRRQAEMAEDMLTNIVIPRIIQPIRSAIAAR